MMKMMQIFSILFFIAILFASYSSIQARTSHHSKRSTNICQPFLNLTNCYYFACIDSIYRCGRNNILVQFSHRFCEATIEYLYKSLTRTGQIWARTSQTCLMEELNHFLKNNPSSSCTDIDRYVLAKYPICLVQSHPVYSICSIMCNNLAAFLEIFDGWSSANPSLEHLLLNISYLCQEQSQMKNIINKNQIHIRSMLWSLCLDLPNVKFQDFHPNEVMIRSYERRGLFASYHADEN